MSENEQNEETTRDRATTHTQCSTQHSAQDLQLESRGGEPKDEKPQSGNSQQRIPWCTVMVVSSSLVSGMCVGCFSRTKLGADLPHMKGVVQLVWVYGT